MPATSRSDEIENLSFQSNKQRHHTNETSLPHVQEIHPNMDSNNIRPSRSKSKSKSTDRAISIDAPHIGAQQSDPLKQQQKDSRLHEQDASTQHKTPTNRKQKKQKIKSSSNPRERQPEVRNDSILTMSDPDDFKNETDEQAAMEF